MTNTESSYSVLHEIIDCMHPHYTPITDETLVDDSKMFGVFERAFKHSSGVAYSLRWKVYYGTPETVLTVFDSINEMEETY